MNNLSLRKTYETNEKRRCNVSSCPTFAATPNNAPTQRRQIQRNQKTLYLAGQNRPFSLFSLPILPQRQNFIK